MPSYTIVNTAADASKAISGAADLFGITTPDRGYSGSIALNATPSVPGGLVLHGDAYVLATSGMIQTLYGTMAIGSWGQDRVSLYSSGRAEFATGMGVSGSLEVGGGLTVGRNIEITGYLDANSYGDFNGEIRSSGNAKISGLADISGEIKGKSLKVSNIILSNGGLTGNLNVSGNFSSSGNALISGRLSVNSGIIISGSVRKDSEDFSIYSYDPYTAFIAGGLFTTGSFVKNNSNATTVGFSSYERYSAPLVGIVRNDNELLLYDYSNLSIIWGKQNVMLYGSEIHIGGNSSASAPNNMYLIPTSTHVSGYFSIRTGDPQIGRGGYFGGSVYMPPGHFRISGHEMYIITGESAGNSLWGKITISSY